MEAGYVWSCIFAMGAVTYLPRLLPFLLLAQKSLPGGFTIWLKFVPTTIFGAMIFSEVFVRQAGLNLSFNNIYFLCSLLVFGVAMKTKSLALTIAAGFLVFWLLQNQTWFVLSF